MPAGGQLEVAGPQPVERAEPVETPEPATGTGPGPEVVTGQPVSPKEEESNPEGRKIFELPVLPLRNTVVFPYMVAPLIVGRPRSLAAVEAAVATEEKLLATIAQRHQNEDELTAEDLHRVGTLVVITKMLRTSGDTLQIAVQGLQRLRVLEFVPHDQHLRARFEVIEEPADTEIEVEAIHRNVIDLVRKSLTLLPNVPEEVAAAFTNEEDPVVLAFRLGALINLDTEKQQALLEAPSRLELLRLIHGFLTREVEILELRKKVTGEAQAEMDKAQRDYVLRQQLRAIQKELGEQEPEQAEAELLRERLTAADLPDDVRKEAERELKRMERLPSAAPDYHVTRTYLEWILELPWRTETEDNLDLDHAKQVLDEDHYGLKDVKDRIIEFLAVLKLKPNAKSPILCLVGPPGVGKTSLGQSIARALGRKFERMSLGGVRDEAELRGHRRTYVGALPGRIIQALRRAGTHNPVLMLDEVDKLGMDWRGDPASALLEVLDPAQNHTFRDHYLDLPFDLRKVFFICTANSLGTVPGPLRDRLEILSLPGYSEEEKLEICKRYLIPRQVDETGLKTEQLLLTDEVVRVLIAKYTREAGVRQLERTVGQIARKVARAVAQDPDVKVELDEQKVVELLGPEKFLPDRAKQVLPAGVATGLAWTEAGGEVLFIEATLLPGGKGLSLTGQLGEVMQESARAAQSYIWSHAKELGVKLKIFEKKGVHMHVPSGAIPKDGPSAGVAMVAALSSLYTNSLIRPDTAMTGEITLSGLVLPVGGVKEKVLAARRAGILRVVLPKHNMNDLLDLPADIKERLEFIPVETISEVLAAVQKGTPPRQNGHKPVTRLKRARPASPRVAASGRRK
ncbi:MAG: endopeptidase La [Acidobacteria bacterium]|nr:endopeptidase La [Acidobacteriota bacterium]